MRARFFSARLIASIVVAALLLISCGAEKKTEIGSQSSSSLLCDNSVVFGFESSLLWITTAGHASSSTRRIQGNASLRVQGQSLSSVRSAPSCLDAASYDQLAFYIASTDTSAARASVKVALTFDSLLKGIRGLAVASKQVTTQAQGKFTRVEVPIPATVSAELASGVPDLVVTISLETAAVQDFLLDDLSLRKGVASPVLGTGPLVSTTISLSYPPNADLVSLAFLGQQGVTISHHAAFLPDCDGLGAIASVGAQQTSVGIAAKTGGIFSAPNVVLGDLSKVIGDVTTAGTISRGNLVSITGQSKPGTVMTPLRTLSWQVQYNKGTTAINLLPFEHRTVPPGAYTDFTVPTGSEATLSTGTYYIDSLDIGLGAELDLITDGGPVVLYVSNFVKYRGILDYLGPKGQLVVVYTGTTPIFLETPFDGFVVAPQADVRLAASLIPHAGAVFAKTVLLDPFARFAPRRPLPILGVSAAGAGGDKAGCVDALTNSVFGASGTPQALQQAILRYCMAGTLGPCETALRAQTRVDFHAAAVQVIQGTLLPCKYLTFVLDREQRLDQLHGAESLACAVLNSDPDGDFIPTSQDSCPNTPSLSAVTDDGCTDPACPNTPTNTEIAATLPSMAISLDPRCKGAPSPQVASPFGAWRLPSDPTVGKSIWLSRDPDTSGCPEYYFVQTKLSDGSIHSVVFQPSEDVNLSWIQRPANVLQFNIHDTDPAGRGSWASYSVFTDRYRVQVVNAAGRKSAWSQWYHPGQEGCPVGTACVAD